MWRTSLIPALGALLALTACNTPADRQWMKINERYTTEEFRRDYAACSPKSELDETCMRNRGWVEVTRSKTERDTDPRAAPPPPSGKGFGGLNLGK